MAAHLVERQIARPPGDQAARIERPEAAAFQALEIDAEALGDIGQRAQLDLVHLEGQAPILRQDKTRT